MATKTKNKAEEAVREYLRYISDPASYEGPDLSDVEAQIEQESDPIAKLKLIAERDRMKDVGPRLEKDFTDNLQAFMEANPDITPEALSEFGVDNAVLAKGGYVVGRRQGKKATTAKRARRVAQDDIAGYVLSKRKGTPFKRSDIANDFGGSDQTIRKVLDQLIEEGKVVPAGEDSSGRGRPAPLYAKA